MGGLPARDSSAEGFSCITPMSFCDLMMSLRYCVNSQNMACVVFILLGLAASNDVRCLDVGSEESTREEVGCGGNEDVKMDEWIGHQDVHN